MDPEAWFTVELQVYNCNQNVIFLTALHKLRTNTIEISLCFQGWWFNYLYIALTGVPWQTRHSS